MKRAGRSSRSALAASIGVGFALVAVPVGGAQSAPPGDLQPSGEEVSASLSASDLMPLRERHARFQVTVGDREPREVEWSRLPAPATGEDTWLVSLQGFRSELLRRDENGDIRVIQHVDVSEGARIEYHPPALLLPAVLDAGQVYESRSEISVFDLKSGARRASGTCRHRVRILSRGVVETPAARSEGVTIAIERAVDVPLADSNTTIEITFVPGRGRVLERVLTKLRVLGFSRHRELQRFELVEEEEPPAAIPAIRAMRGRAPGAEPLSSRPVRALRE